MENFKYIDYNKVLESVGGNKSFVAELMGIYLVETKKELEILSERIKRENWGEVAETAHKMKGQSTVVGAFRAYELFTFIEDAIKSGKEFNEFESQLSEVITLVKESCLECEVIRAKF